MRRDDPLVVEVELHAQADPDPAELQTTAAETRPAQTVGVMAIGEYEFGTSQKEVMTVVSGCLTVKLPGSEDWNDYSAGDNFTVAANQSFQLRVAVETAYLCTYE